MAAAPTGDRDRGTRLAIARIEPERVVCRAPDPHVQDRAGLASGGLGSELRTGCASALAATRAHAHERGDPCTPLPHDCIVAEGQAGRLVEAVPRDELVG